MNGSKRWDVLGIGCNSVDYVYRVPASPRADTSAAKLRISSHATLCGGQTATALAACAGFGLRSAYLGTIGRDDNGRLIAAELERRGVDISALLTRGCDSRFAVITVDPAGDRIVLWNRDDRLNLSPSEITAELIGSASLVHVDDEDQDAAIAAAVIARELSVPVTSDIERITNRTGELIDAVAIPIFAQHALSEITGEGDVERALRKIRAPRARMLCVTLGAAGAAMLVDDVWIFEPGFQVNAIDTTGAGDVFRAALIHGLLKANPPHALLRFANAAAAVSCTKAGAIAGVPSLDEVERMLRDA
jgi:sugar/nucleoside kinase (ribokinase family)